MTKSKFINFKLRAKNPQFWMQVVLSFVVPIGAYFGITGADLTEWNMVGDYFMQAVSNPFVLVTALAAVYNSVIDPTTVGIQDSDRAKNYDELGGGK